MYTAKDIMVATPTHECKSYSASALIQSVSSQFPLETRTDPWWVVAANSRQFDWWPWYFVDDARREHLKDLPDDHYENRMATHRRIVASMNRMRDIFLASEKTWFWCIEADVIVQAGTLPRILERLNEYVPAVLYTKCYHFRNGAPFICMNPDEEAAIKELPFTKRFTLGCTVIHRQILEAFSFRCDPDKPAAYHDAFLAHDMAQAGVFARYDPSIQPLHYRSSITGGWEKLPRSEWV